jgi:hypothetical protein
LITIKKKPSGGPKTAEGKLVASQNAIKTGAYASITVLPGEDQKQYEELEEQFFKDFSPSDLAESAMVRELTSLTWKKLRLEKLEHKALMLTMARAVDFPSVSAYFKGSVRKSAEWFFKDIDGIDPTWLKRAKALKDFAVKMGYTDPATLDFEKVRLLSPDFFDALSVCAEHALETDLKAFAIKVDQLEVLIGAISNWERVILKALNRADDIVWIVENEKELLSAIQRVKDQRLVEFVAGGQIRRAHDDLSRAFYKALSELRKHQEWRRNRPIDITPEPALPLSNDKKTITL